MTKKFEKRERQKCYNCAHMEVKDLISVEDHLPHRNVFVLTCDGQENVNLLILAGNGRWYDKAVGLHRNITHWMPLPSVENLKKGGEE